MSMKRRPLYIETLIECDMDTLWARTQDPGQHQLWDLRFSRIEYLPKAHPEEPQKFLYATRLGFGLQVDGIGESFDLAAGMDTGAGQAAVAPGAADSPFFYDEGHFNDAGAEKAASLLADYLN